MSLVVLMIRLRLFGHDEFALAKQAIIQVVQSGAGVWARLASRRHVPLSMAGQASLRTLVDQALERNPHASNVELWETLLRALRAWNIRQVAFSSPFQNVPRRIRWIDPRSPVGQYCHWSLSVSLPNGDGEICELSAAAVEPVAREEELATLRSLLTSFGARFAAHTEQFFGPTVTLKEPTVVEPRPDHRRKAA